MLKRAGAAVIAAFLGANLSLGTANGQVQTIENSDPQLRVTCKDIQVEMPSGFGSGAWRFSRVSVEYPSASMAQFTYLAKSRIGQKCQRHRPHAGGYVIGTFHFTAHGAVTARLKMTGCGPDGNRVYVNVPLRLPDPPSRMKLDKKNVSVRGRCG